MSSEMETQTNIEGNCPPVMSGSQDELIHEFSRLDELVKEYGYQRKQIASALADLAAPNRRTQKTVHLTSTDGIKVSVEFKSSTGYDPDQMFDVANLLGKETFDGLFSTKVEFQPKRKALNLFMNTVHPSEQWETAKRVITDASIETEQSPYVHVEKPKA